MSSLTTNPNSTVSIVLKTPANPSSAYRAMLTTFDFLKSNATSELFDATSAEFDINDEQTKFTAWFADDHTDQMVEFAVYLETFLHTTLSGKRLSDEERWKRIQNLAKSFNKRYPNEGWAILKALIGGKDAVIAFGGLQYETEEEAKTASAAYYDQMGVTEPVCVLKHADGWFATALASQLTPVEAK